jgi:hypothetical protein
MYVLSVIREMRVRMPYGELKWEIQINPRRKGPSGTCPGGEGSITATRIPGP